MHLDHAGGLPDFLAATVHIFAAVMEACLHPRTLMEWRAYRPEHREHSPKWQPHTLQGDQWFGLDCVPPVRIGEAELVMIPFTEHTRGHCGVALRMGDRWLLHLPGRANLRVEPIGLSCSTARVGGPVSRGGSRTSRWLASTGIARYLRPTQNKITAAP
jgi:hypothetical protein